MARSHCWVGQIEASIQCHFRNARVYVPEAEIPDEEAHLLEVLFALKRTEAHSTVVIVGIETACAQIYDA